MSASPQVTYPGVYIQEVPSGVRTITGVATSVTAFVGYTSRGPTNKPVEILNFADFERQFGGLDQESPVSYATQQFYMNGGTDAWIVRVAKGASKSSIGMKNTVDPAVLETVLDVDASSEGIWGNRLRLVVDYDTVNPASSFNLSVYEIAESGDESQLSGGEVYRNLSMNSFSPSYAVKVVNAASQLIFLKPGQMGIDPGTHATSTSGTLGAADIAKLDNDHRTLAVTLDSDGPHEFDIFPAGGGVADINELAGKIQAAVKKINPDPQAVRFANFTCAVSANQLLATSGTTVEQSSISFTNASQRDATAILKLGVNNGGREVDAAASIRPVASGTLGGPPNLTALANPAKLQVTIKSADMTLDGPFTIEVWNDAAPRNLIELRDKVARAFAGSVKPIINSSKVNLIDFRLQITPGGSDPNIHLHFDKVPAAGGAAEDTTATQIGLSGANAAENLAKYEVGIGPSMLGQANPVSGSDGSRPDPTDLLGNRGNRTGIYALEKIDLFNMLCLPEITNDDSASISVLAGAENYVAERRAILLVDFPDTKNTPDLARQWIVTNSTLRHQNAVIYFPRIRLADPLQQNRLRPFPTCGTIAGLYARTDGSRGVWKAPAGTEAKLQGVQKLDYPLTDQENGVLNPIAVNCLRGFPDYGFVAWGARTLVGSDVIGSEWKYVPVRRLALFLEESLFRGTKWVVFEPNDEPLWSQIRLNIGAFMHTLFRQGAFQGSTAREAYFVKCDNETTTQDDINHGIVNILVGFAPLKPAEFVVIKISQIAGQIQT